MNLRLQMGENALTLAQPDGFFNEIVNAPCPSYELFIILITCVRIEIIRCHKMYVSNTTQSKEKNLPPIECPEMERNPSLPIEN